MDNLNKVHGKFTLADDGRILYKRPDCVTGGAAEKGESS